MPAVYLLDHVSKTYAGQNAPAVEDVSLEVQPGETLGFLGENGAGKTTLIRQMVNLLRSTSGQILLYGQPVTGRTPPPAALKRRA
jgi:ABC-2 type transport system ATP-binding protein